VKDCHARAPRRSPASRGSQTWLLIFQCSSLRMRDRWSVRGRPALVEDEVGKTREGHCSTCVVGPGFPGACLTAVSNRVLIPHHQPSAAEYRSKAVHVRRCSTFPTLPRPEPWDGWETLDLALGK
jgi:hypothetical protein